MSSSQKHTNNGPPRGRWITSTYSGGDNQCVEVFFPADPSPNDPAVLIRDSKDPEGGTFSLPSSGWKGLMSAIRTK